MDENIQVLLDQMWAYGSRVEFYAMDDACPACRALAGQTFDPRAAPVIPVPDCQNEDCRCDYLPVVR